MASAFVEEADHVLGILDHLLELFRGFLFFAGEVLDLDAYTGGFNLQIAWSTGYLAGNSI